MLIERLTLIYNFLIITRIFYIPLSYALLCITNLIGGFKMDLVKNVAMIVALMSSVGLFLYAYFEGIKLFEKKGKVRGEGVIFSFTLAMIFAIFANKLV